MLFQVKIDPFYSRFAYALLKAFISHKAKLVLSFQLYPNSSFKGILVHVFTYVHCISV